MDVETTDWLSDTHLGGALLEEGWDFDFFQAVRLLEAARPECTSLAEGPDSANEAVRLTAPASLQFPPGDLWRVRAMDEGWTIDLAFMGLADAQGPLPRPYVERILKRLSRGDTASQDFLDIFHHRLGSLLYRVRKRHRVALGDGRVNASPLAGMVHALVGLGSPALKSRLGTVADRAILGSSGAYAARQRTAVQLAGILGQYFDRAVRIDQFQPGWIPLDEREQTRLGERGEASALGIGAVLGTRAWDQARGIRIAVEARDFDEFCGFLPPDGERLAELIALSETYLPRALSISLDLSVRATLVPRSPLRVCPKGLAAHQNRLGRTSWLASPTPPPASAAGGGGSRPRSMNRVRRVLLHDVDLRGSVPQRDGSSCGEVAL